jgi:uncharacterized protein (TIGR03083 family)
MPQVRDHGEVHGDTVDTFLAAAAAFADQVSAIPDSRWDGPGLGEWDLRALVGHTSRSLVTVLTYLQQPSDEIAIECSGGYVAAVRQHLRSAADGVDERGRQAGIALGEAPAAAVRELLHRVEEALERVDGDPVITTIGGGMRLRAYLPTRTFELVVHCLDIADATGVSAAMPDRAVAESLRLCGDAAVSLGEGSAVLRVLTGRGSLTDGYNVVG